MFSLITTTSPAPSTRAHNAPNTELAQQVSKRQFASSSICSSANACIYSRLLITNGSLTSSDRREGERVYFSGGCV